MVEARKSHVQKQMWKGEEDDGTDLAIHNQDQPMDASQVKSGDQNGIK